MNGISIKKSDYKKVFNDILQRNIKDRKTCTITVCLASIEETEAGPQFERLKMSDTMADRFRDIVDINQQKYRKDEWSNDNLLFAEYARESDPAEYEIECIDLSSYTMLIEQLKPLSSLLDLDIFTDKKKSDTTKLHFYVITVQPDNGDPIYFFRKYTAKKSLGRSPWLAWLKDDEYDHISNPVLLFDDTIDCISCGGLMFIINKSDFQQIFRFFETIQVTAYETLDKIEQYVPIQNFEEFAEACKRHIVKMRKLKNIATRSDLSKVTMNHLKAVIEKQQLPIQVIQQNGKEVLVYDAKKPWIILNLLEDNYLWSLLTEQGYEVTSKRPVQHGAKK
jgi:hypothetical protein